MILFTVTYTIPAKGTFTEKGLTREGVDLLMMAVIRAGGSGVCR
jgi:hypothetical protein